MTTQNQQNTGNTTPFSQKAEIKLDVFERKILLKLPKNENDIQFIRTILYSKWDKIHFLWVIPNYPGNLNRIQSYFGNRIHQFTEHLPESTNFQNPNQNIVKNRDEVLLIQTQTKRIRIVFGFNFSLMSSLRKSRIIRGMPKTNGGRFHIQKSFYHKSSNTLKVSD